MSGENNMGAAARFGAETQKQMADSQRRSHSAESGHINKCTIVVLTSLNALGRWMFMTADEQLCERSIEGKVIDRLPNLLARCVGNTADTNSAYHILHPNNGAPTRIDERIKVGEGDAVIVSYTVNKAVSEMHGSLSLALFAAGASDMLDLASEFGVHAISIVEEPKAADYIKALAAQVEALQTVNISSIDETQGSFDSPVIDYSTLPGNPVTVLSGACRTFIMQTTSGEVFAAIPNNGELKVKNDNNVTPVDLEEDFDQEDEVVDQEGEGDDEVATGTDLFGYKSETLTVEQMTEALVAMDYDLSGMDDDGIRESFETEQQIWLETSGTEDAENGDEDAEEADEDEDSADDEEADEDEADDEDEDAEFDPVQYLASLLAAEDLDRAGLKVLVRTQDLKVVKSDDAASLTNKLLDLVSDATEEELIDLIGVFVEALEDNGIECPNLANAIADSDEEDEANEVAADLSEDEDEEGDALQDQIDAVTDPLDYFQFAGGALTAEQRAEAITAMGEDASNLSIVQVMKAFVRIQNQTTDMGVADDEDDTDLSEDEDLADDAADQEADDQEADDEADDADSDEDDEDEQTTDPENSHAVENDHLKFLKAIDTTNPIGPMLSVEMDQLLVINFTLTDGNTYAPIEADLADINGVNYRFPFNLGKSGKAPGSMHEPAQNVLEILERTSTTRFLADPKTFDVAAWADSLEQTLEDEIAAVLYEGRIEDGEDPSEAGIVVGDFIDDEELEEAAGLGYLEEDMEGLRGDHLPISSLYNARTHVRPVQVETAYVALNTTVLNIAVPGFWGDQSVARMMQAAVNRVIALSEDVEDVKVYAGFTMESAALLNNDRLFDALTTLREMSGVQSYSAADAANFTDAEDVIDVARTLDSRDLPFAILSGGIAGATFDNGGDLTILVPCNLPDEPEEDEEDEEGDDE